jgi:AcrR family transcriptional regulator
LAAEAPDAAPAARRRDAAQTRRQLLDAARRRFAADGYAATTVRDIADDAGVNVALISRYFSSKEGLFEACLETTIDEMRRATGDVSLAEIPGVIAGQMAAAGQGAQGAPSQLALLLRKSGDERADAIRIGVLRTSAERLAQAAGWRAGDPGGDEILLRAEVVLATAVGIALLRSSTRLEPLASADEQDLLGPLRDLILAILPATET